MDKAPRLIQITGTDKAAIPAANMLHDARATVRDLFDAIVYHGDVPDSVVRADLTELRTSHAAEFARRRSLVDSALKLWLSRGRS